MGGRLGRKCQDSSETINVTRWYDTSRVVAEGRSEVSNSGPVSVQQAQFHQSTQNETSSSCPTPPFPDPKAEVVVAIYPYEGRIADDLSFKKGDLLEIRERSSDWWCARNRATGKKGYIPYNYVASYSTIIKEP